MCASICSAAAASKPQRAPAGADLLAQLRYLRSEAAEVRARLREAAAEGGARFVMLAASDVLVRQLRWVAAAQRLAPRRAHEDAELARGAAEARASAAAWAAAWAAAPGGTEEKCARTEYLCALAAQAARLSALERAVGEGFCACESDAVGEGCCACESDAVGEGCDACDSERL